MWRRWIVTGVSFWLLAHPSARGEPRRELSLPAAIEQALAHNADLAIARAQVEQAAAQLRSAREFPNPTLSLSTAHINTDGRGNGTAAGNRLLDRSYDSIVSLSQLLEIGKRGPRQQAAQAGRRGA